MSEALCACTFPQAVNKYEARYHCDCCGYPLRPDDRRHALLKQVGQEIFGMFANNVRSARGQEEAWSFMEYQFKGLTKPQVQFDPVPGPVRSGQHVRMQFRFMLDP
jgi:hypothetical protein